VTPILPASKPKRPYRAPTGLPPARDDWRVGSLTSALVHLGIVILLLTPLAMLGEIREIEQGAGGPGPAGGGGGGNRGTGSLRAELLRFVRVAPAEAPTPVPPKVVTPPLPKPVLPEPKAQTLPEMKIPELTMITGTGGGTGTDLTAGTGPGSGGGVGTGIGTGQGSAVGPGTGGGNQANYPPTPTEIFIPPLPVPGAVKGHHLIAEFDVDASGKVLGVTFNETRDGGYNRRLREVLRGFRFRPGTRPDGTPIRMKAQVVVDLY
jgi:protein TonB